MDGHAVYTRRSGASFARGVTVDPLLSAEDTKVLYEKWSPEWPEPLGFPGGEKAITCDMIHAVPVKALVRTYGKNRAERLLAASAEFKEV